MYKSRIEIALSLSVTVCWGACSASKSNFEKSIEADSDSEVIASSDELSSDSAGCEDAGDASTDRERDIFDVWREASAALHSSPDNFPEEAKSLKEAGNPQQIFSFIRDKIRTYPPRNLSGVDQFDMVEAVRWGLRGTLRGGAGTPREKAELLAQLLEEIGWETKLFYCAYNAHMEDPRAIFLPSIPAEFAPDINDNNMKEWLSKAGYTQDGVPALDAIPQEELDQLVKVISEIIGDDRLPTEPFSWPSNSFSMPLVGARADADAEWIYLNPSLPGTEWGTPRCSSEPHEITAVFTESPNNITLRVEGIRNFDSSDSTVLVERTWAAEDVVGRRIQLAFLPYAEDAAEILEMSPEDVTFVIPSLTVHSPYLSDDERKSLSTFGTPFSVNGDVLSVGDDGTVAINDRPFNSEETTEDPTKVVRLIGNVDTKDFPNNIIKLAALDSEGHGVAGFGTDMFSVTDTGMERSFFLTRNQGGPRVLLIFDDSNSVPEAFRGESAVAIGEKIAEEIWGECPDALFMADDVGGNFDAPWAATEKELIAQLQAVNGSSSDLWSALAQANRSASPTAIVIVTDGEAADLLTAKIERRISAGAPVAALGVGNFNEAFLETAAIISGGISADVDSGDEAIAFVTSFIRERNEADYELVYTAPSSDESERSVEITFNKNRLSLVLPYTAPPVKTQFPSKLTAISLTVESGDKSVQRVIAGFDSDAHLSDEEPTTDIFQDIREMIHGQLIFSIEAAPPSLSVLFQEMLDEKLSLEAMTDAAVDNDRNAFISAMNSGYFVTPPELFLLNLPISDPMDTESLTYENRIRISSIAVKPSFDGETVREIDMLPINQWATLADTPLKAWKKTLERTAWLNLIEAHRFDNSTYGSLHDRTAVFLDSSWRTDIDDLPLDVDQEVQWRALLSEMPSGGWFILPEDGRPTAFWYIDPQTGSIIGMLNNLTGGGAARVASVFNPIIATYSTISLATTGAVSMFAGLMKTYAVALGKATAQIAVMPSEENFNASDVTGDLLQDLAETGVGMYSAAASMIIDAKNTVQCAGYWFAVIFPAVFCL